MKRSLKAQLHVLAFLTDWDNFARARDVDAAYPVPFNADHGLCDNAALWYNIQRVREGKMTRAEQLNAEGVLQDMLRTTGVAAGKAAGRDARPVFPFGKVAYLCTFTDDETQDPVRRQWVRDTIKALSSDVAFSGTKTEKWT